MVDPSYSEIMTIGSLLIAVVSGACVGVAGGLALRSPNFSRFVVVLSVASVASLAVQYYFWNALAEGTIIADGVVNKSGVGTRELVALIFKQVLVLAAASYLVRGAARRHASIAGMLVYGALGAPVGFLISSILFVLLQVLVLAGCLSTLLACRT